MEHENCIGESDEWYTPPWIFERLGLQFDVDVCSPGSHHWVPASRVITKQQCALDTEWGDDSFVFMNPPFLGRNGHVPFLKKFLDHPGGGIAICRAYTSAGWFHAVAVHADGLFFPRGKTKFIRPDGTEGKAPGGGIVMLAKGARAVECLQNQGWGWFVNQLPIRRRIPEDVRLVSAVNSLLGYVTTCKEQNTEDWIDGLLRHINATLEQIGDDDRIATFEDGFQKITPV